MRRLVWPALAALAGVAAAVPLWSSRFLPFQDAPQHLAAVRVLADYGNSTFAFQRWFELDLRRSQYLGFDLPAAALAKMVGPQAACRLVLTLGYTDELVALALVALWAAAAGLGARRPGPSRWWRLPVLAGLIFAAYLATPVGMGYAWYIHTRALPFLALIAVASPLLAPRRLTSALLAAAVALQIGYAARLASAYRAFDAEADGASLVQVLRAAQPGRRLVSLMFQQRSRYFQFDPYMHFGMYYQVERGGRARYNFAEAPWTPVRFRRDALPVPEPSDWYFHPERFDARREGPDTDYVLIRGRSSGPGPPFVLRERVGSWSLYARWRRPASPVIHLHQ